MRRIGKRVVGNRDWALRRVVEVVCVQYNLQKILVGQDLSGHIYEILQVTVADVTPELWPAFTRHLFMVLIGYTTCLTGTALMYMVRSSVRNFQPSTVSLHAKDRGTVSKASGLPKDLGE